MAPCSPISALSLGSRTQRTLRTTLSDPNLFSFQISHLKTESGQQRRKKPLEERAGGEGQTGVTGGAPQLLWLELGPQSGVSTDQNRKVTEED